MPQNSKSSHPFSILDKSLVFGQFLSLLGRPPIQSVNLGKITEWSSIPSSWASAPPPRSRPRTAGSCATTAAAAATATTPAAAASYEAGAERSRVGAARAGFQSNLRGLYFLHKGKVGSIRGEIRRALNKG